MTYYLSKEEQHVFRKALLRSVTITQKPGELATAPQADTLGSGLTGRRDAHLCPRCGKNPMFHSSCGDEQR